MGGVTLREKEQSQGRGRRIRVCQPSIRVITQDPRLSKPRKLQNRMTVPQKEKKKQPTLPHFLGQQTFIEQLICASDCFGLLW